MRQIRRFLFPDALIALAALAAALLPGIRDRLGSVAPTAIAVVVIIGLLLSLRFHRGRQFMLLLLLGALYLMLVEYVTDWAVLTPVPVLLPVVFAAVALLPERGALTSPGILRLGILALFATTIAALNEVMAARVGALFGIELFTIAAWRLPDLALVTGGVALLVLLIIWLRDPSPVARGLFWSLICVMGALHAYDRLAHAATGIGVLAAIMILGISVVESSYALAYHDGLTGLPGRRALTDALEELGGRYTLAMVDVDRFKQCNDTYGHDVGDQVLRMVAARLDEVEGGGRAYRYGGEEFAVLFPGSGADDSRTHLEAVRAAVESSQFVIRQRPRPRRKPSSDRRGSRKRKPVSVSATISIGIAEGDGTMPAEAVLKSADKMLYRAKENGRNRLEG